MIGVILVEAGKLFVRQAIVATATWSSIIAVETLHKKVQKRKAEKQIEQQKK